MNKYVDKAVIFILCLFSYLIYQSDIYMIVAVIVALIISAFLSYIDSPLFDTVLFLVFSVVSAIYPRFLFFLPLICYDILATDKKYWALFGVIPIAMCAGVLPAVNLILIVMFTGLSFFLGAKTNALEKMKSEYIVLQDTAKDLALQFESKNRELMEKQDDEINIATLNERNRIARDIHDSIGHLLSNAILQTGALLAVCGDAKMRAMLLTLKETLNSGMNSVRDSIHGLYEDSIDLYTETKALADGFDFCELKLDYNIDGNPDRKVKYALIYIMKEALSNVIKHSDANLVRVTLREHPALYQLVVKDNGTRNGPPGEGIGLKNIEQRAASLGGLTNFGFENGFMVFVSIPKERAL